MTLDHFVNTDFARMFRSDFRVGAFLMLQVIIEGYKSYREQVATEDFSPKVNCVGNVTYTLGISHEVQWCYAFF